VSETLIGRGVHVEGWNKACVFVLEKIEDGKCYLITPRTGRRSVTTNKVYATTANKKYKGKRRLGTITI
jgi:hypothetical protein